MLACRSAVTNSTLDLLEKTFDEMELTWSGDPLSLGILPEQRSVGTAVLQNLRP